MSDIDLNDFNKGIVDEFRANDGVVGGPFEGAPMILVTHKGTKTGTERQRLFDQQAALMPNFAEYQEKTDRVIPVVVLTRA